MESVHGIRLEGRLGRSRAVMPPAVMMVLTSEAGLLQLLSGGKGAAAGRALERVRKLRQLVGLHGISVVGSSAGRLLQLTRDLRNDGLKLLWALRLQLLQLIEKLSSGGKAEHISLLLNRRS